MERAFRLSRRAFRSLFLKFIILTVGLPGIGLHSADAANYKHVRLYGVDYIDAKDLAARFGLTPGWTVPRQTLELKSRWTTIEFRVHSVEAEINGVRLFLSQPVVVRGNQLFIGQPDAENLFEPILNPTDLRPTNPPRTVVIDAGHGGADPGNQNLRMKLKEKTYTLDVAKRLERLLKAQGYRVLLTRKSDRAVDLDRRTAFANKVRADLFISIHFNAFRHPNIAGTETYIMTPFRERSTPQAERDHRMANTRYPSNRYDDWSAVLGYKVHRSLVTSLKSVDRGLKRFRYSVLRSIKCPAVLVEAAFLSNAGEARKVSSAYYRQKIAESVAQGVHDYAVLRAKARAESS